MGERVDLKRLVEGDDGISVLRGGGKRLKRKQVGFL